MVELASLCVGRVDVVLFSMLLDSVFECANLFHDLLSFSIEIWVCVVNVLNGVEEVKTANTSRALRIVLLSTKVRLNTDDRILVLYGRGVHIALIESRHGIQVEPIRLGTLEYRWLRREQSFGFSIYLLGLCIDDRAVVLTLADVFLDLLLIFNLLNFLVAGF